MLKSKDLTEELERKRWVVVEDEVIEEDEEAVEEEFEEAVGEDEEVIEEDVEIAAKPKDTRTGTEKWLDLIAEAKQIYAKIEQLSKKISECEERRELPQIDKKKLEERIRRLRRERAFLRRKLSRLRLEIALECPMRKMGLCYKCKYEEYCSRILSKSKPKKIRRWYRR